MDTNIGQQNTPLVSVIMAAYNAERYIDEAIRSIINQKYTNWELIIIDDKSSDKTSYIIGRYSKEDARIKTIRNPTQLGQALARNRGVSASSGKYIAVLDSDDIALPQRLDTQVEFLEKNADVALVGSFVEIINEYGTSIRTKEKACDTLGIHFSLILQSQFIHSSVMMRRSAFEWSGGYDTNYLYAEDYDLWSRLRDKYTLLNINEVLTKFRVHDDSVTMVTESQIVQSKNAFKINLRNTKIYLPNTTEEQIIIMSYLVNNKGSNPFTVVHGLILYRKLCSAYISKLQLDTEQTQHIRMIWRNCLVNRFVGILKGLLQK